MTKKFFSDNILDFLFNLKFDKSILPADFKVMNPYNESISEEITQAIKAFYGKYYKDHKRRRLILGINPGRLGAGSTGIPFTDTKRLDQYCGISLSSVYTHEPSSVFMYNMMDAYGGHEQFYKDFYITSTVPLGFISVKGGKEININYYDNKLLENALESYIVENLLFQLSFGIKSQEVYCLGTGKNFAYLQKLNEKHRIFGKITPLEHPRYIMQYKAKQLPDYIDKYLRILKH